MGSMINIFDWSANMVGTKLLTDKVHRDGSPVRRDNKNAVKDPGDSIVSQEADNLVATMPKKMSSNKSKGIPVKIPLEQEEMAKEMEVKRKAPSVVARLMGLDAFSAQQLVTPAPRIMPGCHQMHKSFTIGEAIQGREQRKIAYNNMVQNVQPFHTHINKKREYEDVYEVRKQPSRINHFKDELHTGSSHDKPREKRVALVHQKYLEAKCLVKNKKLLQSKEFQDALEVLSSNRDIFLKLLEPKVNFSRHFHEKKSTTLSNKKKCITVLKPSKRLDNTNEKQMKKEIMLADMIGWGRDKPSSSVGSSYSESGSLSQPTRIVVLKPSPKQPLDSLILTSPGPSHCPLKGEECLEESKLNEMADSRGVAKDITRKMQESVSSNRRDEMLLSSEPSNGYTGDESSFSWSEITHMEEECGNFSDSQALTPTSRHSWDFISRLNSPCSLSSYNRASCSSESSVIREAKKRLSERLAMVRSNGINQQQTQLQRSSSTLGEMLAFSELGENDWNEELFNSNLGVVEYDPRTASSSCSSSNKVQDGNRRDKPCATSIQKSKSVPSSSSAYDSVEVQLNDSDPHANKSVNYKETAKSKSMKLLFRGKVSDFFSRNKKSRREKHLPFLDARSLDKASSSNATFVDYKGADFADCVVDYQPEEDPIHTIEETFRENLHSVSDDKDLEQGPHLAKEMSSHGKPSFPEIQNMEQPSPVSVLEALLEEDTSTCSSLSRDGTSVECHRSISMSPLIESVTRSLSWEDDVHSDGDTSNLKNHQTSCLKVDVEEERVDFVKKLLSSSGLDNETISSAPVKWFSLESPLNPLLLDKFMERREEGAKCRERRSRQRLLFDCVSAALTEISQNDASYASRQLKKATLGTCNCTSDTPVAEEVMQRLTRWFSLDDALSSCDTNKSRMIVDYVIKKEIFGRGWEDMIFREIMEIEMEIERQMLDELVLEAVDGFISSGCNGYSFFSSCFPQPVCL